MDDDQLLDELGTAVREAGRVPTSFLAAGRAAFAWRNIDAELATMTAVPLAGVRSAEQHMFTFAAGELSLEVEFADDAILGQVVPPQAGTIEVRDRTGTTATAAVDELGWFALRPVPAGMFRLHFTGPSGGQVLTEWLRR